MILYGMVTKSPVSTDKNCLKSFFLPYKALKLVYQQILEQQCHNKEYLNPLDNKNWQSSLICFLKLK